MRRRVGSSARLLPGAPAGVRLRDTMFLLPVDPDSEASFAILPRQRVKLFLVIWLVLRTLEDIAGFPQGGGGGHGVPVAEDSTIPPEERTTIFGRPLSCDDYGPRSRKALLPYESAHSIIVKRGIAASCLGSALKKSCFHVVDKSFNDQPDKLLLGAGEDDFSIEGHIKSMKRELQKDIPDMERIEDSMSRTFASRRQWVAAEHPSVQDILRRYPALERTEEIFREFERFGGEAPIQTVTAVAQLQMATVLDVAAKRVEKATWDILERVDTCSTEDKHLMTTLAFLVTLPRTVREQTSSFVKDVAPWFSKYPSVIWSGDPDDVGLCMVQVEDQLIKADHPVHAILVAFCLHWVADICYQPGARGFYALLEHLLGLQATKPTTMVVTALSAMKETLRKK
ncbi:uncharacterized protein ISCGN_022447 [Ixodes scapularis]